MEMITLSLDLEGQHCLQIPDVIAVARPQSNTLPKVVLSDAARERIASVRAAIEKQWLHDNAESQEPIYGINTGVGALKSTFLQTKSLRDFQSLYVKSHSVGVGAYFEEEVVRAAILLRANSFAKGYSGIRLETVEKLLELLNKGIYPMIPERGSLGASGDLGPLSHLAAVLVGEPKAVVIDKEGKLHTLRELAKPEDIVPFAIGQTTYYQVKEFEVDGVRFETHRLEAKEAMGISNGTTFMLALATLMIHDAMHLMQVSDLAASLSLEAMMGEKNAFDTELNRIRNIRGQIETAQNIRLLTKHSQRMTEESREAFYYADKYYERSNNSEKPPFKKRVQDRYSLRCVPQVHGASKDAFRYVQDIVKRELNAPTDNPLIFWNEEKQEYYALSGGNFHGQPLAIPMDVLSIALAELGNIADRRIFALINKDLSYGLPSNLVGVMPDGVGMNTGMMLTQYTSAALVSENKTYCHPASVDSIPSSGNQEDHVSMGTFAARKARMVIRNVQYVLAIELLCAIQALHISDQVVPFSTYTLGERTQKVFDHLSLQFPFLREDVYMHARIEQMCSLIRAEALTPWIAELLVGN